MNFPRGFDFFDHYYFSTFFLEGGWAGGEKRVGVGGGRLGDGRMGGKRIGVNISSGRKQKRERKQT